MRRLSDTIAQLAALRSGLKGGMGGGTGGGAGSGLGSGLGRGTAADRLTALEGFGSNPGALDARIRIPDGLEPGAALVVVLHGCTQTAAGYDAGSGWSQLADAHGFAVLFPEQARANNPNLCFNWFAPSDAVRDQGEALSIRQMIERVTVDHGIDPARVYVTGLSAGGAMAATMLACYPEVFAGGAIIAGLPHGAAATVPDALALMRGQGVPGPQALTALARDASAGAGNAAGKAAGKAPVKLWPSVQVWHGSADKTVHPANGEAILAQWRGLHGVADAPDRQETIGRHLRREWRDEGGRIALEHYAIDGMAHGAPLATRGPDGLGAAGPFMLEVGLSSTRRIAASWGLTQTAARRSARARPAPSAAPDRESASAQRESAPPRPAVSVLGKVIEDALRKAGLMR